jgi:tRNA(fMet)-specific endonuclease VapC
MARYMLDTDICIYVIKNRSQTAARRFLEASGEMCLSIIAFSELQFGVEKSDRREESLGGIRAFLSGIPIVDFDETAAVHYAQIRAELERSGKPAGTHDMMIGGHARSLGLVVVTNNVREFGRMPGVHIENWA